jgi:hypothetical protein
MAYLARVPGAVEPGAITLECFGAAMPGLQQICPLHPRRHQARGYGKRVCTHRDPLPRRQPTGAG